MEEEFKMKQKSYITDRGGKWGIIAERLVYRRGLPADYSLDELKAQFVEYVDFYNQKNVVYVQKTRQKRGGSGNEVGAERVEKAAPMTEWSFCLWIGKHRAWLVEKIAKVKADTERGPEGDEYLSFLEQIRTFLNSQLLEGAILGEYTPTLVASLLHIKNKIDMTSNGKTMNNGVPVINIVADKSTREDYQAQEAGADVDDEVEEDD